MASKPTPLHSVAETIAFSDPRDRAVQEKLLDDLARVLRSLDRGAEPEVWELVDCAVHLMTYLARRGEIGGVYVHAVVQDLLNRARALHAAVEPDAALPRRGADARDAASEAWLGSIMVKLGLVQERDLDQALVVARDEGIRVGEALVRIGRATTDEVVQALRYQDQFRLLAETFVGRQARGPRLDLGSLQATAPGAGLDVRGLPNEEESALEDRLGDVLVENGIVTPQELEQALELQRASGEELGEVLRAMGACRQHDIDFALRIQAGRRKRRK